MTRREGGLVIKSSGGGLSDPDDNTFVVWFVVEGRISLPYLLPSWSLLPSYSVEARLLQYSPRFPSFPIGFHKLRLAVELH
jgi:hypothetical protein